MTTKQQQAVWTCIQAVITAVLLAIQTIFFGGCVSAGGDVNQTNDIKLTVPSFTDALKALKTSSDSLTLTFDEFETIDDQVVELRSHIANNFYNQQ